MTETFLTFNICIFFKGLKKINFFSYVIKTILEYNLKFHSKRHHNTLDPVKNLS